MGAPEKSQANTNSMQRVKVYRLNEDGKWDDQGTGHVTVDYMERSEELGLFVIDEEDNETLLLHRISSDDIYRKQEDTIISWRDPEYSTELALSFQESTGCSYIWDHICSVQRNLHFNSLNNETFHSANSELRELPVVELSTLPLILKTVAESGIADQMRLTELILTDQEFFRKLMGLFRICEDLENVDGLHMIYKIVRGIILLNSPQIFEKIFGDDLIMDVIGSLEYDPEVPHVQHHRNFLKEHVVFKEVYFLHEFCSLSKSLPMVQQLRLFRDLMNEGIFDIVTDALQSQDKKLVLTGTDILNLFMNQDPNLLRSYVVRQEGIPLLGLLVKGMITDFGEDMHCQFLEILRSLLDSYTLSGAQRDAIIEIFYEKHLGQLIDVITVSCPLEGNAQSIDQNVAKPEILSNICELLCFCVLHHPYRIKCNFLLNNVIDKVLLVTQRREKYLVVAAVRFVRTILSRHDEHLINHIVKNNLLKPIVGAFVGNGNRYNLLNSAVLELFEFIRKENLKALVKYLVDSFWDQLVKFEFFASVQALKVKYEQCLESFGPKGSTNVSDPRKRTDERALEKEEEDYFNEDSDEEDTASASMPNTQKVQAQPQPVLSNGVAANHPPSSPRSVGLVDYDDDEDDEDYKPPPRKHPETSDEDEGTMESLRLKRKLASKDREPELAKRQRLGKNSKPKESVFAALCTTLSQAVLPNKKTASNMHTTHTADGISNSGEGKNQENEHAVSRSCADSNNSEDEDNREKEPATSRGCCDRLHGTSENRQLGGEDCPLIPPKSSPEMAVNGS
ncbi:serine/threonine-protein phosphatase 4 regulatory subunit 3 isoform X3 [Prunus dulcis]|uniref:serine/threonine-protein phosphatase 4 regulatory subunit 3 isoform X3 n=1 Tax=Prunus dulcis TaxID=3755 RepID=UPI001481E38C|nr:serine/threonine-protein phosphatase 4 regulatory subunit 3 isoform X3 [Prunus dulcis]